MRRPNVSRSRRASATVTRLGCSAALLGAWLGCGDAPTDAPRAPRVEEPTAQERQAGPSNAIFDANGELLPSDERVAGLTLPRGLQQQPAAGERHHVYTTRVPAAKLLAYFGPRLMTGEIDRHGESVTYRGAIPNEARGAAVKLDVTVFPTRRNVRVEIYERPPPPANPLPPDELIRRFDEDMRRLQ